MDARIVVGVDGSESSRRALRWAARQSTFTGAPMEALISWEVPPDYGFDTASPHDMRLGAESILQAAVAEVLGDDPALRVELSTVQGHPVPALLNAAKGASLLVLGSRGRGAFAGLLLGSVSTHCVTHATCPVTVVQ